MFSIIRSMSATIRSRMTNLRLQDICTPDWSKFSLYSSKMKQQHTRLHTNRQCVCYQFLSSTSYIVCELIYPVQRVIYQLPAATWRLHLHAQHICVADLRLTALDTTHRDVTKKINPNSRER